MKRVLSTLAVVGLLALPAAASERWVRMVLTEDDGETSVRVQLPIGMLEKLAEGIPSRGVTRVSFHDVELSISDLRRIWAAVERAPEGRAVIVRAHDHEARISREGDRVRIVDLPRDRWAEPTEVMVRADLVRALLSGARDRLDLAAVVRAVDVEGGTLVLVRSDDSRVEISANGGPQE